MARFSDLIHRHSFVFTELVKRDFKHKYKGTALGMLWSVLDPLLHLLVMKLVFTQFFGRNTPHYTTYLFCGTLIFSYFSQATNNGMNAIVSNGKIISKVKVPKYLFLLSKNVSCLINFALTICVFFLFVALDHLPFTWKFFLLLYPVFLLILFNIGAGMILSTMFVFFRDTSYLYGIFLVLLRYMSAIFYNIASYPAKIQRLFMLNPVYCYIRYFRLVVIDGKIPSPTHHALCLAYAVVALAVGALMYKRNNVKFLYYL